MTYTVTTRAYALSRDRFGHWEIRHCESGKSVYLQGDDARQFQREIERVPVAYLDLHVSEYHEVLS